MNLQPNVTARSSGQQTIGTQPHTGWKWNMRLFHQASGREDDSTLYHFRDSNDAVTSLENSRHLSLSSDRTQAFLSHLVMSR